MAGKARPVAASKPHQVEVPAGVPTAAPAAAAVPMVPFRAQDYVPMSMIAARLAGYARPSTQAELQTPFVSAADSAVAALTAAHQAHMVASSNKGSTPAPELLLLREQLSQLTELTEQCHYFGAVPNPLCAMHGGSPTTTECGVKGGGNSNSTSNCHSNNSNSNANSNRSSSMTFSNSNSSSNAPPTSHSRSSSSSTLTDQDFGSTTSHQSESGHAHVSSSSLLSSSVPNPLLSQQQQQEQHKQEDEDPQHDENEDDEYNQQDDDEMEERRTPSMIETVAAIDATSATIQTADNPGDHEGKTTRPTVIYTTSKSQTLVFTTNKGIVG